MKKALFTFQTLVSLVFTCVVLLSPQTQAQNLAITSIDRNIPRFQQQVERLNQGNVDILWIGDSITRRWEADGKDVWEKYYGSRNAMNFGISADHTAHVLWRLEHAPMEKISPKIIILLIGTNNLGLRKPNSSDPFSTPSETVEGIQKIVNRLKDLYPKTKIVLMELFPRSASSTDALRLGVQEVNQQLESLYQNTNVDNVKLCNINNLLLDAKGELTQEIMSDYLHPTAAGYEIWANAVEPMIVEALEEKK